MPRPALQDRNSESSKKNNSSKKTLSKWVFITKDGILDVDSNKTDSRPFVCKLRHPRTGTALLFLVSGDCRSVCELNCFDEKYHSWFIGDTVHSSNQMYFATPVDPLYLILPYLMNAGGKSHRFMSLDQLVQDEEYPDCEKILSCSGIDHIIQVADLKDIDDDLRVYRYNKNKTLAWLKSKTEACADVLEEKQINVSTKSSQSAIFVRSKSASASRESYLHYAVGVIADYLPLSLEEELRQVLNIPIAEEKPVKPASEENEPPKKKAKFEGDMKPTDDYSEAVDLKKGKNNTGKLTSAQKKLSKVDKTGMKSIASFFSPKSKA